MGNFGGIDIEKENNQLGATKVGKDKIAVVVIGGVSIAPAALAVDTAQIVSSLDELKPLGITPDFDETNSLLVYRHLAQFLSNAPEAQLHVILRSDNDTAKIKEQIKGYLQTEMGKEVKLAAVAFNYATAPTYSKGFAPEVLEMADNAQAMVEELAAINIYLDAVIIEGRAKTTYEAGLLHDFSGDENRNVAIVSGRQHSTEDSANNQFKLGFADVGAYLGSLCARDVAESAGSVDVEVKPKGKEADENYPLNFLGVDWKDAGVPFGDADFATMNDTLKEELEEKHILFAGRFNGYPGIYWSGSETAVKDSDDFSRIERNRAWNKAARIVVDELTPKIRSKVPVNADGTLRSTTVTDWKLKLQKRLKALKDANLISGYEVTFDTKQNILAGAPIVVGVGITPIGIAEAIVGKVKLSNPFNK